MNTSKPLYGAYWSSSLSSVHAKAHSAIAFTDEDVVWTYRPDSCRLMLRMVYSMEY